MNCEECMATESQFICLECEELLCEKCDTVIHRGGKRKSHSRLISCSSCKSQALQECSDCGSRSCLSCSSMHMNHNTRPITISKSLALFWDITYFTSQGSSFDELIHEVSQRISAPSYIQMAGSMKTIQST